ncbi:hypothetical protein PAPYR_9396 [Paratrimastix pyriformis]|uniref:Uncharacterized protein n=1 Tax=Paratrimastix pyriformis TaxID=342808 RepID=A0ABQ8U8E2_9EUKA|nr:hypothetical protein PAPYR_9396 [Paratrimastix pyriformis]
MAETMAGSILLARHLATLPPAAEGIVGAYGHPCLCFVKKMTGCNPPPPEKSESYFDSLSKFEVRRADGGPKNDIGPFVQTPDGQMPDPKVYSPHMLVAASR